MDKEDFSRKVFALGSEYVAVDRLGKGTYGTVYKVKSKNTNNYYAIKIIKNELENEGIPSTALRECAIMKAMIHPNICKVIDCQFSDQNVELCLEYCKYDLKKLIEERKHDSSFYTPSFIKNIMFQLLKAVDFLHSRKILHRDLKPQNVLVTDKNWIVKLTDFGLSRVYSIPIRPYTKEILTLWYRAPEMMVGITNYSIGLDMWSIGCIFGEMLITKPLFMGDSEIDQLLKIFQVFGTANELTLTGIKDLPYFNKDFPYHEGIGLKNYVLKKAKVRPDDFALDLMEKMLAIDSMKRITCKEALAHPYFNDVHCTCHY